MVLTATVRLNFREVDAVHAAIRAGTLPKVRRLTLSGNDAIVKAAIEVGARAFFGYPITPASELEEESALKLLKVGGVFLQTEDEIAAMAAGIGASLGGLKAFTATSGPGFSLKQENLGFACLCEIPLVVVNVQRGGPSTGGPTDVGQSDVMQARWGTHGDHPIIVLAPSSVQECYGETVRAFNLSEKYRTPVILLTDAKVGQMKEPVLLPPVGEFPIVNRERPTGPTGRYEPFGLTESGVPPLAAFGDGYRAHFTGLYHGRDGLPTKDPRMVDEQLRRIHAKLETPEAQAEIIKAEEFLTADAEVVIIAFGITARAAKDAVILARREGIRAGLLRPITLWPSPEAAIIRALSHAKKVIVPEINLGQYCLEVERLAYQMSQQFDKVPPPVRRLNRVDTLLIYPQEILKKMRA